jgi:hypothetical protein
MACDECRKVSEEEAYALRSLQEQRTVNRTMNLRGKEAEDGERRLEEAYNLACAKNRLHLGTTHQDEGHKVSMEDVAILLRGGVLDGGVRGESACGNRPPTGRKMIHQK